MTVAIQPVAHDDRDLPSKHIGTIAPNYYCRGWNPKRLKYCKARAGFGTNHPGTGRCKNHGGNNLVTHGQTRRYELHNAPRLQALIQQYVDDPEPLNVAQELAVARALMHDFLDRYAMFVEAITAWYDTWDGRRIPIPEEEKAALLDSIDEYAELLATGDVEPTEQQQGKLELARSAIVFLSSEQQPKPRQILDVSDAMKHVDTISKIITRAEQLRAQGTVSIDRLRMFLLALDRGLELEVSDQPLRDRLRRMIHGIRV